MNKFILVFLLTHMLNLANASEQNSWDAKSGMLGISGQAAIDLYESLDASAVTGDHYYSSKIYMKRNKFASCSIKYTETDSFDEFHNIIIEKQAFCEISAPNGTVLKD